MALEGLKAGIFGAIGRLKGKRKLDEAEMKELSTVSYTHLTLPTNREV